MGRGGLPFSIYSSIRFPFSLCSYMEKGDMSWPRGGEISQDNRAALGDRRWCSAYLLIMLGRIQIWVVVATSGRCGGGQERDGRICWFEGSIWSFPLRTSSATIVRPATLGQGGHLTPYQFSKGFYSSSGVSSVSAQLSTLTRSKVVLSHVAWMAPVAPRFSL